MLVIEEHKDGRFTITKIKGEKSLYTQIGATRLAAIMAIQDFMRKLIVDRDRNKAASQG